VVGVGQAGDGAAAAEAAEGGAVDAAAAAAEDGSCSNSSSSSEGTALLLTVVKCVRVCCFGWCAAATAVEPVVRGCLWVLCGGLYAL